MGVCGVSGDFWLAAALVGLAAALGVLYLGQFLAWAAGPGVLSLGEFARAFGPDDFLLALAGGPRPPFFRLGLALGGLGLVLLGVGAAALALRVRGGRPSDLGSARLGSARGMREVLGSDGLVLGRKVRLSSRASFEHVAVVGPTGCGKSSGYFVPNLLVLEGPCSLVVSDPKGELYDLTSRRQKELGREVLVFAPLDPARSVRYNPLRVAPTASAVRELAHMLLVNGTRAAELMTGGKHSSPEWITLSVPLLSAALLRAREIGEPVDDVASALDFLLETPDEKLLGEFQTCSPATCREFLIYAQALGSERTASSIRVTVSTGLGLFNLPEIREVTSGAGFDPARLRERPTVVYVQVPERKASFLSPLMSVFYQQLIDRVLDREGLPVYFLLDEFANIGVIPDFPRLAATARSRRISLSVGIQGVEQLEGCYGREAAQDILNNLKVKLFFPGLSTYSAEYASRLCGQATAEVRGWSREAGRAGYTEMYSAQKRDLMTPDEVRRLGKGRLLVVAAGCDPVLASQLRYYEDRRLRKLVGRLEEPVREPAPGPEQGAAPRAAAVPGERVPPGQPADPLDWW